MHRMMRAVRRTGLQIYSYKCVFTCFTYRVTTLYAYVKFPDISLTHRNTRKHIVLLISCTFLVSATSTEEISL